MIGSQGNQDKLSIPDFQKRMLRITRAPSGANPLSDPEITTITPEDAARRIVVLTEDFDFILFEYVKTDLAGHSMDADWADQIIGEIIIFLLSLLQMLHPETDTLLISSDHGNSEDLSVKTHTLNPVPAVAWGRNCEQLIAGTHSIADLVPAILRVLKT